MAEQDKDKSEKASEKAEAAGPAGKGRAAVDRQVVAREPAPAGVPSEVTPFAGHPRPSVGRAVHYVLGEKSDNAGEVRPAIVNLIHPPLNGRPDRLLVNLTFFAAKENDSPRARTEGPKASYLSKGVPYDPDGAPGTWHWPDGTNEAKAAAAR